MGSHQWVTFSERGILISVSHLTVSRAKCSRYLGNHFKDQSLAPPLFTSDSLIFPEHRGLIFCTDTRAYSNRWYRLYFFDYSIDLRNRDYTLVELRANHTRYCVDNGVVPSPIRCIFGSVYTIPDFVRPGFVHYLRYRSSSRSYFGRLRAQLPHEA